MGESYRGQCNLHLYLARQYLAELTNGDSAMWGGHHARASQESAIHQLQLAYEAHLGDILFHQPRFQKSLPTGRVNARILAVGEYPPEIAELAEREVHDAQISYLVNYAYVNRPDEGVAYSPDLIGSAKSSQEEDIKAVLESLTELVGRHRAGLLEY